MDYADVFTTPFNHRIRPKFAGYFFINGDVVAIPYLMDNNRENIHLYRDRLYREYWRFFLYSKTNRGYKFYYDLTNDKFVSRDCHGVDFIEDLPSIDFKDEFDISPQHVLWSAKWLKWFLKCFRAYTFEIDTLYNKLILAPINILMRAIILMKKRPNEALGIIKTGNFARLLSTTTRFNVKTEKPFANYIRTTNNSNFLRHPNSNQIEDWQLLSQIVKPSQEQIKLNKKIPDCFDGFICPYDLNANIKNFAKFFNIVYDVQCYQPTVDNTLDILINQLIKANLLVKTYDENSDPESYECLTNFNTENTINIKPLLINGTLPTPYTIKGDILSFYHAVKKLNPWIEVRELNGFPLLNRFAGMPMKPYKNYYISPYELNTFEQKYYQSGDMPQISLIGELFLKSRKLALHDRSVGAASYFKSSLTSDHSLFTCTFSNEVVSTFISTNTKDLPHFRDDFDETTGLPIKHTKPIQLVNGNFIPLKVAFAANLHTNEDAYVINEKLNFNIVITKKMNYDFTPSKDSQFILADPNNCAKYICNPKTGRREELLIKIATVYTTEDVEPAHYTKIICIKRDENIFDFYKTLDSKDILDLASEKDINFNIEVRYNNGKAQILLEMIYRVPYYDGIKLCNLSAQKGLGFFQNLSQYRTKTGEEPDLIMSLFGIIGRCPFPQLQEMADSKTSEPIMFYDQNNKVSAQGFAGTSLFYICKNNASVISMAGTMKIDHLTNICFSLNNASLSLFAKIQDRYKSSERGKRFPLENMNILELYGLQKTFIECRSELDVNNDVPAIMEQIEHNERIENDLYLKTLNAPHTSTIETETPTSTTATSKKRSASGVSKKPLKKKKTNPSNDDVLNDLVFAPNDDGLNSQQICTTNKNLKDPISIKNRNQYKIIDEILNIVNAITKNNTLKQSKKKSATN